MIVSLFLLKFNSVRIKAMALFYTIKENNTELTLLKNSCALGVFSSQMINVNSKNCQIGNDNRQAYTQGWH